MDRKIMKILDENKTKDKAVCNFVCCYKPFGIYYLDVTKMPEFMSTYSQILYENKDSQLFIAEMPKHYSMFVIDVDLACPLDGKDTKEKTPLYTAEHLTKFIKICQDTLKKTLINYNENKLSCVLLEKEPYVSKTTYKSGFHLAFPYVFIKKTDLDFSIYPIVASMMEEQKLFSDIGKDSKVLDFNRSGVYKKPSPWLLYGSMKNPDTGKYKVTKVFGHDCKQMDTKTYFSNYKIYDGKEEIKYTKSIEYYYPYIFLVNPYGRDVSDVRSDTILTDIKITKVDEKTKQYKEYNIEESLEFAKELVSIMNDTTAEPREEWISVGFALYNMFHSSAYNDGLNLWLMFSQKCKEKYDRNSCIRQWKTFTKGTYGIQTLRHFAKRDNPHKYVELTAKRSSKILESSINLKTSHFRIAKIIYEMYSEIYVCADVDPDIWYKFENHHWTLMAGALDLGTRITGDISRLISTQLAKLYTDKANNPADGDLSEIIDAKIKFLTNIQSKIEDYNFKKNVIKEARALFYQENFTDKLGRNKYLIGFKNGVYDFKEYVLRDGRPDDYISLQMPIAYRVVADDDPDMLQLHDFFMKVHPDANIRKYFLDRICEFFIGGNARKIVDIWSGLGNNAKTVMIGMLQNMFGPYCIECPANILTSSPPKPGAPFPELARAGNGARLMICQEPANTEEFNTGTLKKLSGNDVFWVRGMYQKNGVEIHPMFKIVLLCNKLPRLDSNDPAVWNRIRVIPYEAEFCDKSKCPESLEQQYKEKKFVKDENFSDKIVDLIEPLAYFLLERLKARYKGMKNEVLIEEPAKVLEATNNYRESNDIFAHYIRERIITFDEFKNKHQNLSDEDIKRIQKEFIIRNDDLYIDYRFWHKSSGMQGKCQPKDELILYFTARYGNNMNKDRRIRTQKDDEDDGLVVQGNEDDLAKNPLSA